MIENVDRKPKILLTRETLILYTFQGHETTHHPNLIVLYRLPKAWEGTQPHRKKIRG